MYKFQPILKSTIWGGEKIVPYKQIASGQTQVGESWELSGVKGNESVVAGGPEAGTTLPGLIARHGAALLGKANFERFGEEFPLLIKFIDARQDLSIQVHPDDRLAWERHKSKGKTEMWYVVDADKGARLRSGFAKQVTPAQYEASVEDNTITDILNTISNSRGINYDVELVRKDLIAMAASAEADGQYLPAVIGDVETFKLDLLASIPHPKLIDYMLDSLVWMCIYGLAMSTTCLLLHGAWDSHFDAATLGLCIVVMMPSAWLMQRIVPASWLSYGKGLRYGIAQTVLLALWLVEFGLIYNWVYPNLPNIGIPNVVAAALFAVLTLALRAWRTHRCNQLADARPWRDVVDSKKQ